jgi:hypothetical protein
MTYSLPAIRRRRKRIRRSRSAPGRRRSSLWNRSWCWRRRAVLLLLNLGRWIMYYGIFCFGAGQGILLVHVDCQGIGIGPSYLQMDHGWTRWDGRRRTHDERKRIMTDQTKEMLFSLLLGID